MELFSKTRLEFNHELVRWKPPVRETMSALQTDIIQAFADSSHSATLSNSGLAFFALNGKCLVCIALWEGPGGLNNTSLEGFTHGPLRNIQGFSLKMCINPTFN